jgi:GR25 family glycosyltransferase involved in LPS biosynthesis
LIDGVVVINLDHRPERLESFAGQAAQVPAFEGWQRLAGVDGSQLPSFGERPWFRGRTRDRAWGGRAGCTLSHRKAIALAREKQWKNVLIFEDDVNFGGDTAGLEARLAEAMNSHGNDWHVLYLGASEVIGPCHQLGPLDGGRALYATQGCIGAFAYLVKQEAYDWILARLPDEGGVWKWISRHRAIDRWFARNLRPAFSVRCVFPSLIGHFSTFSDIGRRAAADIRTTDTGELRLPARVGKWRFAMGCAVRRVQFAIADFANRFRSLNKRLRGF